MKNRRTFLATGLAVAAVLVVSQAVAYKAMQNQDRRARFQQRDIEIRAAREFSYDINERVMLAARRHISMAEFQETVGPVSELHTEDPRLAQMTHSFYHKPSQRTCYLRFEDGMLMGHSSGWSSSDVQTGVVLETPGYLLSENVRRRVLSISVVGWLAALAVCLFSRRLRRAAAMALPVLAALCTLCWFLSPAYSPTWRGMSSNDMLAFAAWMLVVSLVFGLVAVRNGHASPPAGKPADAS